MFVPVGRNARRPNTSLHDRLILKKMGLSCWQPVFQAPEVSADHAGSRECLDLSCVVEFG